LLQGSRIQSLHTDAEGNLWIATQNGLILHSNGRFARLTSANGLHDSDIRQILDDLRGNLWFSSRSGIFRVSKAGLLECALNKRSSVHSTVFGPEDGFASLEGIGSIQPASSKTSEGKLCFATTEGMAVIDPVHAAALDAPISAVIEEVIVDNKQLSTPNERRALKIPAGYQHLSLRFTGLSFVAPERTQFRFRMAGIDSDWVSAGGHRIASYGRLPGGSHRFEVVAQSRDGTWPERGAVLLFQVAPRYWETAWFRGVIVAAVFALVALFWFQRLAREREINAVREQITRDLHDDLGSNLGSIALLTEALQRPAARTNNEQLLQEINRIARQTLDGMRDTLWFVDPGKDSVADLIAHLRQLADSMLKNTPHEFRAPEKLELLRVPLELKRGVVLIFKEALHNALRHSQATHVNVFTNVEQHRFFFEVVDDGIGFNPSNSSGGHGLDNMKHRAEKLRGKIEIASEQGRGTRVRFEVNLFDG
jgi:signal transduction histidine kinase